MLDKKNEEDEKIKWHRLLGLVLQPVFQRFGFDTEVEVDLSFKKQLIDLTVVRKKDFYEKPSLPEIYIKPFMPLNDHNLISFKSHNESFTGIALEEFYGHATNYRKKNGVPQEKLNLYALTNHKPVQLFKTFLKSDFLTEVVKDEIYDLNLSTMTPVRFIITRNSDHPLLSLFSDNHQKVMSHFLDICKNNELFQEVSQYLSLLFQHYGIKEDNMYTAEDFSRDYPNIKPVTAVLFPKIYNEGRDDGLQEGKIEEGKSLLYGLLRKKFGDRASDKYQKRLDQCSLEQIEQMSELLLTAQTIEEVFSIIDS